MLTPKVDITKYSLPSELGPSDQTSNLSLAKIAYLQQENTLLNLEIAEERDTKGVFLAQNAVLEDISKKLGNELQTTNSRITDVQNVRLTLQEKFFPQLCKYTNRRDEALMRRVACEKAYLQIVEQLQLRGFDYNAHLHALEKEKEWSELAKLQDSRVNDTARQYETVHVEDADDDQHGNYQYSSSFGHVAKKSRIQ